MREQGQLASAGLTSQIPDPPGAKPLSETPER